MVCGRLWSVVCGRLCCGLCTRECVWFHLCLTLRHILTSLHALKASAAPVTMQYVLDKAKAAGVKVYVVSGRMCWSADIAGLLVMSYAFVGHKWRGGRKNKCKRKNHEIPKADKNSVAFTLGYASGMSCPTAAATEVGMCARAVIMYILLLFVLPPSLPPRPFSLRRGASKFPH